jgi:hypothetical protein
MNKGVALILVIAFISIKWVSNAPQYRHDRGVLIPENPYQKNLKKPINWEHKGYTISSKANFSLRGRIILTDSYWWTAGADISPVDLSIGWGLMSDTSILEQIEFGRCYRCLTWRFDGNKVDFKEVNSHTSNIHTIPANDLISSKLKNLEKDDLVYLKGFLVNVNHANGFTWKSSLTRTDVGNGACELMWIDEVDVLG